MPGRSSSSFSSSSRSSFSSPSSSYSRPSSSYSSSKSNVSSYTSSSNSTYTKPQIINQPPIQQTQQQQTPGFFSNMWQGFGLGAGQAIAHNIFSSDPVVTHKYENAPKQINTSELPKEFIQCMKDNNNDKEMCKQFLE
jgi:hypothetical protein